jgi:benzodiazapine receptor
MNELIGGTIMNTKAKSWFHILLYVVTLIVNTLGAFGIINGMSQKEVSDTYPTLITPRPSTFSIWFVIYVMVFISLIYMVVKHRDVRTQKLIDDISVPFWIANILWIITFSFELIGLSTVLIFIFVIALAVINRRLSTPIEVGEKINAAAFGLYNGWLIIATVVNVAAFLVQIKWDRFGVAESTWTLITLIAAFVITLLIQLRLRNAVLTLPLAWAYFGIWQEHQPSGKFLGQYPSVALTAIIIACLFVVVAILVFFMNGRCVLPKKMESVER